jgi:hypothetical protein
MDKARKFGKWIVKNFFLIIVATMVIVYLRWFWLTPLVFEYYNDPNAGFLVGATLFIIFFIFTTIFQLLKNGFIKSLLLPITILLAVINIWYIFAFFPMIENHAKCSGRNYYITWMHPFGDYQWIFDQLTIWEGLHYESHFFGYSQGPFDIICDEERGDANIIRTRNGVLTYSHGESSQGFDDYAGVEFDGHRYFLSFTCNNWHDFTCSTETYTLYECNIDYKSCDSLHIAYTSEYVEYLELDADLQSGEINLYDDHEDEPDRTLIFTYGEHPQCYVEGCEILEQK